MYAKDMDDQFLDDRIQELEVFSDYAKAGYLHEDPKLCEREHNALLSALAVLYAERLTREGQTT